MISHSLIWFSSYNFKNLNTNLLSQILLETLLLENSSSNIKDDPLIFINLLLNWFSIKYSLSLILNKFQIINSGFILLSLNIFLL